MSILQQPNVTICSPFRDSEASIAEYFDRLFNLDYPAKSLRFVAVEGDSQDSTWDDLVKRWEYFDARFNLIKCDTGKPKYGSVVNAERFQVLAQVFNAALDAVDYEWTDYVLFLPSDIRYQPDLLSRLLAHGKDIISPFVWVYLDGRNQFYDIWAFSRDGTSYMPFMHLDADGLKPIQMHTVGGVTLIKADVLKAGCRYTPDEVDRGLCKAAKAKGFTVWADPTTHVYHPPFAPDKPVTSDEMNPNGYFVRVEDWGLTEIYGRDAERVMDAIYKKYGFRPPIAYVRDLIAFMSEFVHDRE
jgi:glycosyltransferase involved in cell wall biosynthesis